MTTELTELIERNVAAGQEPEAAKFNAERELRFFYGDPYLYRTDEELEEMRRSDAAMYEAVRESAGVSEEFPRGEFAVPGFNCDLTYEEEESPW